MVWKDFSGAFRRALALLPSVAPALVPAMLAAMMAAAAAQDGGRLDNRRAAALVLQREGNFFVGGSYNARDQFVGQMYVEYRIPKAQRHPYPIILVHGGGQIGGVVRGHVASPHRRHQRSRGSAGPMHRGSV